MIAERTCSLCGHVFDPTSMACHTSCPMSSGCHILCCPNCGYQVPDEDRMKVTSTLKNAWEHLKARQNKDFS